MNDAITTAKRQIHFPHLKSCLTNTLVMSSKAEVPALDQFIWADLQRADDAIWDKARFRMSCNVVSSGNQSATISVATAFCAVKL